jgi:catechol-2,3-dioxygenase
MLSRPSPKADNPVMFQITRLNHAVLYVRDAARAAKFYQDVLGFAVYQHMGDRAYFLRTNPSTDNNHDLGLFSIGPDAATPTRGERVGLYHLAWQVETLPELAEVRDALVKANALVGVNDHGSSLSLYAQDPDGNEFEVMWQVPAEEWETRKGGYLDIEGEMQKRGMTPVSA